MTNEEAIHQLECIKEQIATYEINTPRTKVKSWPKIVDDTIKMAEEALRSKSEAEEYRTPKKIKWSNEVYVCPRCGIAQQSTYTILPCKCVYCFNCGQAIDWSEVEE